MRFKIDCTSFIVGSKFTVFALFYFVFEGNFPRSLEGRFNGGFFCVTGLGGFYLERLIFGILGYLQLLKLKGYSSYLMADQTSAKESVLLSLKMKRNKINIDSISGLELAWEK